MANGETGTQADQLAKSFADVASSLVQFREANSAKLSDTQFASLGNLAQKLEDLSDQENVTALAATLANVRNDAAAILASTKDAQQAVKTIKDIQNVIAIGGAVLTLAGAVAAGNVATIATSAQSLVQAVAAADGGGGAGGGGKTGGS